MVVQLDTVEEQHVEVHLHDLAPKEKGTKIHRLLHTTIQNRLQKRQEPLSPVCPTEEALAALNEEFSSLSLDVAHSLTSIIFLTANILPEIIWSSGVSFGIKVDVRAMNLPIGAGLGSSSAFAVALAGALLRLRQLLFGDLDMTLEELAGDDSLDGWIPPLGVLNILNGWAYAAEVIIHEEPSGLDNTTSCFGGAVSLNRTLGRFETLAALPDVYAMLINTKVSRNTRDQGEKVRALNEVLPSVMQPILESVENISQVFLSMLEVDPKTNESHAKKSPEQFLKVMGALFNINHNLLYAMGVGHSALTTIKESSSNLGLACKLTGAGGGGCAMTLLESKTDKKGEELQSVVSEYGYETYCSQLGGFGIKWHLEYPKPPAKEPFGPNTSSLSESKDLDDVPPVKKPSSTSLKKK
eukprot:CAMPEP_0182422668 /NCGR_PEP_ID=MMETSP1167-20130531/8415_1 /TAXON_ID=2988 /ORGANISM="Mallomonas Sp, Strain CCMP3275" /LENGTH=411 /DNA_ID=CAMNT_0024600919 /DNA_START=271 /DNA_END=1506 /DNA_ORIENTATION=+